MNMVGQTQAVGPVQSVPSQPAGRWTAPLMVLAAGLILLVGLVFAEEAAAAVRVWNSSTAYNHCWLIGPIAAWLAWQRRDRAVLLSPSPDARLSLLAIPPALVWLVAERLGILEGRQLAAWSLIQVFVLSILGWRVVAAYAGPLAYTIFLVPFGGFAVPILQHITARFIEIGLIAWGVTHYVDGLLIETTAGTFHVAEACAGLRFSIAALAFGALYALTMFRSPARRLIVLGLAVVVPIIANGLRANERRVVLDKRRVEIRPAALAKEGATAVPVEQGKADWTARCIGAGEPGIIETLWCEAAHPAPRREQARRCGWFESPPSAADRVPVAHRGQLNLDRAAHAHAPHVEGASEPVGPARQASGGGR